jgi:ureidoglycolate hydrolase
MAERALIQKISSKSFRPFGRVIEYSVIKTKGKKRNLWKIVHRSTEKTGWRVAYLVLRDKTIRRLECHPDSDETLEPVKGRAVLFISVSKDLSALEVFELDKPVIVDKGVWHGLICLEGEAHIKIVENEKVGCQYFPLRFRMDLTKWEQIILKRRER